MSSAILGLPNYNPPTLSYRGSVDITSAEYGSTLYNLFYDASLVSLGSVLMFEVKTIQQNIIVPNPDTVSLSFISIENATNTGISNQWQIAVPSTNDNYDPNIAVRIAVRVYIGITGTAEVGVTEWSNELDVHNPPAQPVIRDAFYNTPGDEDDLYIFLDLSENSYLVDGSLNFVAAFYYQDNGGSTVWDVSVPLTAQQLNGGFTYMLHVPNFGFVSTDPSYSVVYTSLYAVYEFQDDSNNNFYSVSHISNTVNATPAADLPPVVTSVDYAVYNSGDQTMTVYWDAPLNADIPAYNVASYNVYVSTDPSGSFVMDASGVTDLFYAYDVSSYPCGTTVYFKIQALLTDGSTSPLSDTSIYSHLNIFYYADAPTNLEVTNTSYSSGNIGMTVNFTGPVDEGCGTPVKFVVIIDGQSFDVGYDAPAANYSVVYTNLDVSQTGIVEVYLVTEDTNPSVAGGSTYPERDGASTSAPYVAVNLVLDPVDYQVYVPPVGSQDMDLTWNDPVASLPGGWEVLSYDVEYQIQTPQGTSYDNNDWQVAPNGSGISSTNYTFDASYVACDNTVYFRIIANLVNITPEPDVYYSVISNIESINMFRYADAPTDLVITNTSYNGLVTLTVNFTGPANEGCGAPLNFVVIIDGQSFDVEYDALAANYSVTYNNLEVSQTGIVEVYLVTQDTNGNGPENGASVTTPYIATDLVLNPVDYQVYVPPVGSQDMNLSWNGQDVSPWALATNGYKVYYKVNDGSYIEYDTTNNTNIVFNAATEGVDNCGDTISFYVEATLENGAVTYVTSSAPQSINIFKYADAPAYANVLWASADASYNYMDIRMVFTNPSSVGCGAVENFVVNVLDACGNILTYYDTADLATQNVTYDEGASLYTVNFNQVTYAPIGSVEVYLVTTDTNSPFGSQNGAANMAGYVAGRLPIYQDVSMNNPDRTLLTFNVITQTPLVLVNGAITGEEVGGLPSLAAYQWFIDNTTPGVNVVIGVLANNELRYSISMDCTVVGSPFPNPFPTPFGLVVSNQVGIQEYNVDEVV
jgi:hypothetical protein